MVRVMKKLKYLMTLALVLVLGLTIYYFAINKSDDDSDNSKDTMVSEVEKMLSKDLENSYPESAREVVSYFIDIQECYYNEEIEDDKLVKLAYQAMKLFDEKLVEANPFDKYYADLTKEIKEYRTEGKTLYKTILDKASEIEYSETEGVKYAKLNCIYYLKTSKGTDKVTETYALRCDADGKWKILGWQLYEPDEKE